MQLTFPVSMAYGIEQTQIQFLTAICSFVSLLMIRHISLTSLFLSFLTFTGSPKDRLIKSQNIMDSRYNQINVPN